MNANDIASTSQTSAVEVSSAIDIASTSQSQSPVVYLDTHKNLGSSRKWEPYFVTQSQGPEEEAFYLDLDLKRWPGGMRFPSIQQIRAPRLGDVLQRHSA